MTESPYLTFGPVGDTVGVSTLVAGLAALALAFHGGTARFLARVPRLWLLGVLAFGAALLSAGYIVHFLRGGPRIIDAAAYTLEARTLAEGAFAFSVPEPSGSFRGRFLLPTPDGRLSVIFPPGYPALLALGVLAGAPLAVGPLLAALLVPATYFLSRAFLGDVRVARLAAALSALSAALRYHTADTMSHGLSALLFCVALAAARRGGPGWHATAGLAAGWLTATRPVTGVACSLLVLAIAVAPSFLSPRPGVTRALRSPLFVLAGAAPGVMLLWAQQAAVTGRLLGSSQLAYYALADGPPGCFRWGFGHQVGCVFEHADVVKHDLPNGFGVIEAARVTFDRLSLHTIDVANFAPFALAVPLAVALFWRERGVRWLGAAVLAVVLAYAPFYFPGSYPGGGARFFADALPAEHALLALFLVRARAARFAVAGALLGFALHAVHGHRALAEREGGKPMFSRERLAGIARGLVFVTTDHGFLLGHDPAVRSAAEGVVVARLRGDAHDSVLWDRLGRPASFVYDYSPATGRVKVAPYRPEASRVLRFELEAEWPPLGVRGGFAHPDFRPCLSGGAGLHLRAPVSVEVELVPLEPGAHDISVGWLADPGATPELSIGDRKLVPVGSRGAPGCTRARVGRVELGSTERLTIYTREPLLLDYVELTRADSKKR